MVIVQATEGLLSSDLHTSLRLHLIIKDQVNSQKDVGNLQWTLLVPHNKKEIKWCHVSRHSNDDISDVNTNVTLRTM